MTYLLASASLDGEATARRTGTGADVMKRIAAPMIGGIFTSFLLELVIYPPLYQAWKWHSEVKPGRLVT